MIDINFLHTIIDEEINDNLFKKLNHEQFFNIIEKSGIDLDELASQKKKNDYTPFHRFNFILKELHQTKEVDISDACVYILTQTLELKDLLNCLNEENKYMLRLSLAERHNKKIRRSSLDTHTFKRKKVQKS